MAIFSFFYLLIFRYRNIHITYNHLYNCKSKNRHFFNSPHMEKLNFLVTETRWCRYITK